MITRRSLADAWDALEDRAKEVAEEKGELFMAYRQQLKDQGHDGSHIKAEIAASKAAFRMRRKLSESPDAVQQQEALVTEILHEIQQHVKTGTPDALRARIRATRERVRQPSTEEDRQAASSASPQTARGGSDNDPLPAMPPAVPHKPQDMTDVPFLPADDGLEIPADLRRARG